MERFVPDPYSIIETRLALDDLRFSESLFSLGNGSFGLRGNFEEDYSGDSHRGTYLAGVWYPDKTRVGWWKNGYPAYYGKMINAVNLIGTHIRVNGVTLDAAKLPVIRYRRELQMQRGVLSREMTLQTAQGAVELRFERFVSMASRELLGQRLCVTPAFEALVEVTAYLDASVQNEDSHYGESFWLLEDAGVDAERFTAWVLSRTRENLFGTPRFSAAAALACETGMKRAGEKVAEGFAALSFEQAVPAGGTASLDRHVCVLTDRDHSRDSLCGLSRARAQASAKKGYEAALRAHEDAWGEKWLMADVNIQGDERAQQGIRFCQYQLLSTYTGEDPRLNIGPKGFTGEKYGGATYWDTEAFCFPVYLAICGDRVARQLLLYRHRQLTEARHNARMQGLPGALFPMVTFDGVECHNEWEITFEEIHRNAAVAHAIFHYTSSTGDSTYLLNEGLEVLLEIARFWAGRVHRAHGCGQYMLHGVTGPNEYENNVCNNWYTNRMAAWCLQYFCEAAALAGEERRSALGITDEELRCFGRIADGMYLPECPERGVFVQHDTFLDKELLPASAIPPEERPICRHWSWDRILRSCFIKQADVLQGLYFLGHLYGEDEKRRNFDFYEPMTVHESSLSPCVHSILASELGYGEKARELFLRTVRLDLDNINRDTADGLHVTGMAGGWLAVAHGFAGLRTAEGLSLSPYLPEGFTSYGFRFLYRSRVVDVHVDAGATVLTLERGDPLSVILYGEKRLLFKQLECAR